MEIKKIILDVRTFLEKRPDFISFDENAIQSAINQSETLLDSECNGLISEVWKYNTQFLGGEVLDNGFNQVDPGNELYRTQWEMSQIIEAHIAQVQHSLNMGNDFSQGSESISMGGFNGSFSRPSERTIIAPGVYKLLQNARVYNLQFFGSKQVSKKVEVYDQEPITRSIGDKRYLNKHQPNVASGKVAYVNESHNIDFANPQDINITTYNTNQIKDPQTGNYVPLDKVKDLAFFGKNLTSAIDRAELLNLVSLVNMNYSDEVFYRKGTLMSYAYEKDGKWWIQDFLALKDTKGNNPLTSEGYWQKLGTLNVDLNNIVQLTYDRVVAKYDASFEELKISINDIQRVFENEIKFNTIPQEVEKQLDKLKTIRYLSDAEGEIKEFANKQDFETYKRTMGIDDSYFEDVKEDLTDLVETPGMVAHAGFKIGGKVVYAWYMEGEFRYTDFNLQPPVVNQAPAKLYKFVVKFQPPGETKWYSLNYADVLNKRHATIIEFQSNDPHVSSYYTFLCSPEYLNCKWKGWFFLY